MATTTNCVKISCRGLMRHFICDVGTGFDRILEMAIERFDIPREFRHSLRLTNGQGYGFDKQLFDYFLLLFPSPEITFYLRLDYNSAACSSATVSAPASRHDADARLPFAYSKLNNKRTHSKLEDADIYEAVPVHRQNCFLGALPTSSSAIECQLELESNRPYAKRLRTAMFSKKPSTARQPKSFTKRCIRL